MFRSFIDHLQLQMKIQCVFEGYYSNNKCKYLRTDFSKPPKTRTKSRFPWIYFTVPPIFQVELPISRTNFNWFFQADSYIFANTMGC